jgi:hypothetical protein
MNGNIYIKTNRNQSLDAFVGHLPNVIGCRQWEQRQSSNYVEERYFRSFALGIEVTVAIADRSDLNDYDFWLFLEIRPGRGADRSFLDDVADCIAWCLASSGYTVLRPYDLGNSGMLYRPASGKGPRESVVTEEV